MSKVPTDETVLCVLSDVAEFKGIEALAGKVRASDRTLRRYLEPDGPRMQRDIKKKIVLEFERAGLLGDYKMTHLAEVIEKWRESVSESDEAESPENRADAARKARGVQRGGGGEVVEPDGGA